MAGQRGRSARLKCLIKLSIWMKVIWLEFGSKIWDKSLWKAPCDFLATVFCLAKIPRQHLSLSPVYPLLLSKCHTLVDWSCVAKLVRVASVLLILPWAENTRAFCALGDCKGRGHLKSHFMENPQAIQVPPQRPSRASMKWLQLAVCPWCRALNVKNSVTLDLTLWEFFSLKTSHQILLLFSFKALSRDFEST